MSADEVRTAVTQRFPDAGQQPAPDPSTNEFVIFSKPELGRLSGAHLDAVWDLFAAAFADHGVQVHRIEVLTGPELERSGVMQEHYGVINQISRLGRPALTDAAEQALTEAYAGLDEAVVLGGHQVLQRYPEISGFALAILFANADVRRLGPGTYAAAVEVDGEQVVVLNGFHPRQLSFFTADDAVCAFLQASSTTAWETLRSQMIGTTDPSRAAAGSVRGTLYADPAAYGLATVSSNFNGVHMSAGPLEGLGELKRFFGSGRPESEWSFGQALRGAGLAEDQLAELLANPVIEADGSRGTAFDLTEGVDAPAAATLLAAALTS